MNDKRQEAKKSEVSVKKNYIYSLAYQILAICIPLITAPYISRALGAENIGIYSYTYAQMYYFILFGTMGLSTYSQLQIARLRDKKEELSQFFIEVVVLRLFTMGFSILIYAIFIMIAPEYKIMYVVHATVLLAYMIDVTWFFQGLENFRLTTIRNMIVRVFVVICIFIFVKSKDDLLLYTFLNGFSVLLGNLTIIPYVKKSISFQSIRRLNLKCHLKAAFIFLLPSIASLLLTTVDKVMLGMFTEDKMQNGFYEQASKIDALIFTVFSSLNIIMRSRMSYLKEKKRTDEIIDRIKMSLQYVIVLALPISFGLFCISDIFVPWFFGEEYLPVIAILKIFSFWTTFKAISNCLLEQYIVPVGGGQILATKIIWLATLFNVIGNAMLIPRYGAAGAASASVLTEFLILIMVLVKSNKIIKIKDLVYIGWKKMIAGTVMAGGLLAMNGIFAVNILGTIVQVFVGAILYSFVLILLKDDFAKNVISYIKSKGKKHS